MAKHFPKDYVPPRSDVEGDDELSRTAPLPPVRPEDEEPKASQDTQTTPGVAEVEAEKLALEEVPSVQDEDVEPVEEAQPAFEPMPQADADPQAAEASELVAEPEPVGEAPKAWPEEAAQPEVQPAAEGTAAVSGSPLQETSEVPEQPAQSEPDPESQPAPVSLPDPDPQPEPAQDATSPVPSTEEANKKKRRRRGIGLILSNLLIIAGIAMMATAGGIYVHNERNYQKIEEENERVAEYAKLSTDEDLPPEVNWDELKAVNGDVVGWLQIPGTVVNYPVFQAENNDYYLDHAPDRSSSIGGSVFLDFESTAPGMVDAQTIIYGHHMRNGSQFKQVADMDDQALFDNVKTVWYVTENGNYNLAPVFLYYTSADDLDVREFTFKNAEEWHTYLKGYLDKAVTRHADAEQIVDQVSHVLTLSTCNYYDGYGRTILVCAPKSEIPGTTEYEQTHGVVEEQPVVQQDEPAEGQEAQPVEGELTEEGE